jgi:branched-chain amino acid aminotransferase
LLNSQGALAEASAANLFLVVGDELLTPCLEDGAMPGLMREQVIAALGAREQRLSESDLFGADESFLTNSLSIRPLLQVNGRAIGNGRAGPVTSKVQRLCGVPRAGKR